MTYRVSKVAARVALLALLPSSGYLLAEGPRLAPIVYSGTLMNGGIPVSGTASVGAVLWPTAQGTTDAKCRLEAINLTLDDSGRFRLSLDSCAPVILTNPELWLELQVNGTLLAPRIKIAAVPYALRAKVATSVVHEWGSSRLTLQGGFCGATSPVDGHLNPTPGSGGFAAAKRLCEEKCSRSPTAHVCQAEEVVRLLQLGGGAPTTTGWIATGMATMGSDGMQCVANDCQSFNSNDGPDGGAPGACGTVWTGQFSTTHGCDQPAPILCCD